MDWIEIIIAVSIVFLALYYWSTMTFNFWNSLGVLGPSPLPLVGNFDDFLFGKKSFGQQVQAIYNDFREESTIGIFINREPYLILVDPELIKDVLIKDFAIFTDRGIGTFDETEPLSQSLFHLEPARWRLLRAKLSPVFTSKKLKKMFYLLLECGQHLEEYLEKFVVLDEVVEFCELTQKFTTNVIGSCMFGLEMNALPDEDSEFRKMGRELLTHDWKKVLELRLQQAAPWLYSLLGFPIFDSKCTNFFMEIMLDVIDYRKNNKVVKHDFIDLIMKLRDEPDTIGGIELSDTFLAAQFYTFFIAGFETSATTMSNALYELAQYQPIQERLRREINEELAKNNGELTYEGIKSMEYLDLVFKETLRKYPLGDALQRKAAEDYTFAGTKLSIPKGTKLIIPILGIHRDPRIYPEPETFDPERFMKEATKARHPMNWLGFGSGPRNCIGGLFGIYQTKIGLIKILHRYKVQVCEKTQIPYVFKPHGLVLSPMNGIYLKISKVD